MEFQVFVKPVGSRCNLSCDYCYYHDRGERGLHPAGQVMKADILGIYIKQHLDAWEGDNVMFSWHGGEPLLAGLDFYRKVIGLQKEYNREGKRIINGIQTNGMLLDNEWCSFLSENGFIVGLSIDGPAELHNMHRKSAAGIPSHNPVLKAWDLLKLYNISHELLCVVSNTNVAFPLDVYNFFRERAAEYITFLPLVEREGDNEVSPDSVDPLKFGQFLVSIFDAWKAEDIGRIKIQVFEEALRTAFGQEHTLCIFRKECGGVPLLEKNGNFYTCDHYADNENLVGNIRESSLATLLLSRKQTDFGRYKETSLPLYCRQCEVIDMCNGECPRNRFVNTPDGEPLHNYLCPGYMMLFNHIRPFADMVATAWKSTPV